MRTSYRRQGYRSLMRTSYRSHIYRSLIRTSYRSHGYYRCFVGGCPPAPPRRPSWLALRARRVGRLGGFGLVVGAAAQSNFFAPAGGANRHPRNPPSPKGRAGAIAPTAAIPAAKGRAHPPPFGRGAVYPCAHRAQPAHHP